MNEFLGYICAHKLNLANEVNESIIRQVGFMCAIGSDMIMSGVIIAIAIGSLFFNFHERQLPHAEHVAFNSFCFFYMVVASIHDK